MLYYLIPTLILIRMELILLEKVINLGNPGDLVTVKKGYARNFLIPHGKAAYMTEESKAEFETKRDLIEKSELGKLNKARDIAERISNLEVELKVAVSEEQSMYGSIGTKEISEQLISLGYEIFPQFIRLTHGSFKELGSFNIDIELHPEVIQNITVNILAED